MSRGRDALIIAAWFGLTGWGLWRASRALIAAVHGLPNPSRRKERR